MQFQKFAKFKLIVLGIKFIFYFSYFIKRPDNMKSNCSDITYKITF